MRLAGSTHPLVSVGAVLSVLALAGATLAWRAGGAGATPGRPAIAAAAVVAQVEPSTTSSTIPATTSTSTTSAPTTSTTVKPKPVTTTAAPRRTTTVPTTPPTTPPAPVVTAPLPTGPSAAERCASARQWVAEHGLALPAGWGFRCPGPAVVGGTSRWGMACWNCEGNRANWIAIDVARIGASDATLRYVIAHETCHAIDYVTLGQSNEIGADLCAALHGAPRT